MNIENLKKKIEAKESYNKELKDKNIFLKRTLSLSASEDESSTSSES